MRNFFRATLIGHVGNIIDYKEFENGKKVINFSIAYNYRGKNEKRNRTEWHKCTLWGKSASYLKQHLKSGDCLLVEGEYRSKPKQDSIPFCEMYLNITYVQFVSKKDVPDITAGEEATDLETETENVEPIETTTKTVGRTMK